MTQRGAATDLFKHMKRIESIQQRDRAGGEAASSPPSAVDSAAASPSASPHKDDDGATSPSSSSSSSSSASALADRGGVSSGHSPHSSMSKPSLKEVLNRNFAAALAANMGRQPGKGGGGGAASPHFVSPMVRSPRWRSKVPQRSEDDDGVSGESEASPASPTSGGSSSESENRRSESKSPREEDGARISLAKALNSPKSTGSAKSPLVSPKASSESAEKDADDSFGDLMSDHPLKMHSSRSDETHRMSMLMTSFPQDGKVKADADATGGGKADFADNARGKETSLTSPNASPKSPKGKDKEKDKENRQGDSTNVSLRSPTGPVSPRMAPSAVSGGPTATSYWQRRKARKLDQKEKAEFEKSRPARESRRVPGLVDWVEVADPASGLVKYYNTRTKRTQYKKPESDTDTGEPASGGSGGKSKPKRFAELTVSASSSAILQGHNASEAAPKTAPVLTKQASLPMSIGKKKFKGNRRSKESKKKQREIDSKLAFAGLMSMGDGPTSPVTSPTMSPIVSPTSSSSKSPKSPSSLLSPASRFRRQKTPTDKKLRAASPAAAGRSKSPPPSTKANASSPTAAEKQKSPTTSTKAAGGGASTAATTGSGGSAADKKIARPASQASSNKKGPKLIRSANDHTEVTLKPGEASPKVASPKSLASAKEEAANGEKVPDVEQQRRMVILELIASEVKYVTTMSILMSTVINPVKAYVQHNPALVVKNERMKFLLQVFNELQMICNFNTMFLKHLQKLRSVGLTETERRSVGDLFHEFAPFFKLYAEYNGHHSKTLKVLKEINSNKSKYVHFRKFIKECLGNPICNKQPLAAFLKSPLARIPRYVSLLKTLLSYTSKDADPFEHQRLRDAVRTVGSLGKEVLQRTLTSKQRAKHQGELLELSKKFDKDPNFMQSRRKFLRQGSLLLVGQDGSQETPFEFFLFNNLLASASTSEITSSYVLRGTIKINEYSKLDTAPSERRKHCFEITSPNPHHPAMTTKVAVQCPSAEVFETWTNDIKKSIKEAIGSAVSKRERAASKSKSMSVASKKRRQRLHSPHPPPRPPMAPPPSKATRRSAGGGSGGTNPPPPKPAGPPPPRRPGQKRTHHSGGGSSAENSRISLSKREKGEEAAANLAAASSPAPVPLKIDGAAPPPAGVAAGAALSAGAAPPVPPPMTIKRYALRVPQKGGKRANDDDGKVSTKDDGNLMAQLAKRLAKQSRDKETVIDYTQSVAEKATTLRALDMDMDYGDGITFGGDDEDDYGGAASSPTSTSSTVDVGGNTATSSSNYEVTSTSSTEKKSKKPFVPTISSFDAAGDDLSADLMAGDDDPMGLGDGDDLNMDFDMDMDMDMDVTVTFGNDFDMPEFTISNDVDDSVTPISIDVDSDGAYAMRRPSSPRAAAATSGGGSGSGSGGSTMKVRVDSAMDFTDFIARSTRESFARLTRLSTAWTNPLLAKQAALGLGPDDVAVNDAPPTRGGNVTSPPPPTGFANRRSPQFTQKSAAAPKAAAAAPVADSPLPEDLEQISESVDLIGEAMMNEDDFDSLGGLVDSLIEANKEMDSDLDTMSSDSGDESYDSSVFSDSLSNFGAEPSFGGSGFDADIEPSMSMGLPPIPSMVTTDADGAGTGTGTGGNREGSVLVPPVPTLNDDDDDDDEGERPAMPGMGFGGAQESRFADNASTAEATPTPNAAADSSTLSPKRQLKVPQHVSNASASAGSSAAEDGDSSDREQLTGRSLTGLVRERNMRSRQSAAAAANNAGHLPAHTTVASSSEIDLSNAPQVPRVSKLPPPPAPPGPGTATGMAALSQPVASAAVPGPGVPRGKAKRAVLVGAPPPVSNAASSNAPNSPGSPPMSLSRSQLTGASRPSMSVGKPARARMVGLPPSQAAAAAAAAAIVRSPASAGGPLSSVPEDESQLSSLVRSPSSQPPLPSVAASQMRLARFSISPHLSGSSSSSSSQGNPSPRGPLTPTRARMVGAPPRSGLGSDPPPPSPAVALSAAAKLASSPKLSPASGGRGVRARMVGLPPAAATNASPPTGDANAAPRKMTVEDEYLHSMLTDDESDFGGVGDSDDEGPPVPPAPLPPAPAPAPEIEAPPPLPPTTSSSSSMRPTSAALARLRNESSADDRFRADSLAYIDAERTPPLSPIPATYSPSVMPPPIMPLSPYGRPSVSEIKEVAPPVGSPYAAQAEQRIDVDLSDNDDELADAGPTLLTKSPVPSQQSPAAPPPMMDLSSRKLRKDSEREPVRSPSSTSSSEKRRVSLKIHVRPTAASLGNAASGAAAGGRTPGSPSPGKRSPLTLLKRVPTGTTPRKASNVALAKGPRRITLSRSQNRKSSSSASSSSHSGVSATSPSASGARKTPLLRRPASPSQAEDSPADVSAPPIPANSVAPEPYNAPAPPIPLK